MIKETDAEKVVLKFTKQQYEYIKSIPIHHSQKAKENKNDITVTLHIVPNYELEMKILAWNKEVEVIEPESLRKKIENRLIETLKKYKIAK